MKNNNSSFDQDFELDLEAQKLLDLSNQGNLTAEDLLSYCNNREGALAEVVAYDIFKNCQENGLFKENAYDQLLNMFGVSFSEREDGDPGEGKWNVFFEDDYTDSDSHLIKDDSASNKNNDTFSELEEDSKNTSSPEAKNSLDDFFE